MEVCRPRSDSVGGSSMAMWNRARSDSVTSVASDGSTRRRRKSSAPTRSVCSRPLSIEVPTQPTIVEKATSDSAEGSSPSSSLSTIPTPEFEVKTEIPAPLPTPLEVVARQGSTLSSQAALAEEHQMGAYSDSDTDDEFLGADEVVPNKAIGGPKCTAANDKENARENVDWSVGLVSPVSILTGLSQRLVQAPLSPRITNTLPRSKDGAPPMKKAKAHPFSNGDGLPPTKKQRTNSLTDSHNSSSSTTVKKDYFCDWDGCGRAFGHKSHLTRHIRTVHEGRKDHVCTVEGCGKSFRDKRDFVKHVWIVHEGRKDFICQWDGCGRSFGDKRDFLRHVRIVHEGKKELDARKPSVEDTAAYKQDDEIVDIESENSLPPVANMGANTLTAAGNPSNLPPLAALDPEWQMAPAVGISPRMDGMESYNA